MVPPGIMFHNCFTVPLGSLVLRFKVFRATCIFDLTSTDVLSPNVMLNLSNVKRVGEICLSFGAGALYLLIKYWVSDSKSELVLDLYWIFNWGSESNS